MKGSLVEKCEWDTGQNVEENHGGNHAEEGLEKKLIEYSSGKKWIKKLFLSLNIPNRGVDGCQSQSKMSGLYYFRGSVMWPGYNTLFVLANELS